MNRVMIYSVMMHASTDVTVTMAVPMPNTHKAHASAGTRAMTTCHIIPDTVRVVWIWGDGDMVNSLFTLFLYDWSIMYGRIMASWLPVSV